jgi:hypothetical protein
MVLDALFGVGPPRHRCALAVHIGRLYTALAIAQGDRQVEMRSMCSRFSMPSFASDPPSLSSRRPPLGRLYRSCHRTERFFKSRRAHRALMVLDALFGVGPPPPRCTRPSTSDVFTALAIVQGDCTSRDALIVRSSFSMPPLASDRRVVAVLSPSTLDVCIPLSPSRKATVKSRCARYAHGSRCPLLRRTRRR